jgi:hypothetical protein
LWWVRIQEGMLWVIPSDQRFVHSYTAMKPSKYSLLSIWNRALSINPSIIHPSVEYSSRTFEAASFISFTGKNLEFGSPPAKDMTLGFSVTFSISLMNDFWVLRIRSENNVFIFHHFLIYQPGSKAIFRRAAGSSKLTSFGSKCSGSNSSPSHSIVSSYST